MAAKNGMQLACKRSCLEGGFLYF